MKIFKSDKLQAASLEVASHQSPVARKERLETGSWRRETGNSGSWKFIRGFTLIELLVVIALLGILAIALLATIDPLEQLKKGRDTSTRNVLEEFNSGALRYYANKGEFPWTSDFSASVLSAAAMTSYIQSIVGLGELKAAFLDSSELEKIYLSADADDDTFSVCYLPNSKAFRDNEFTKYNISGVTAGTACPDPTSTSCYWCIVN